jgi:hypothetical protein
MSPDTPTYPTDTERSVVCTSKLDDPCSVCPECRDQFIGAGGLTAERRIVAWLRGFQQEEYDECGVLDMPSEVYGNLADAIERGEHRG